MSFVVVVPVVVALLLAALLMPLASRLRSAGAPQLLSAWVVVLGLIGLIAISIWWIVPAATSEASSLGASVSDGFTKIEDWLVTGPLGLSSARVDGWGSSLRSQVGSFESQLAKGAVARTPLALELVAGAVLVVVLTFFFVKDGPSLMERLPKRFTAFVIAAATAVVGLALTVLNSPLWLVLAVPAAALTAVGIADLVQTRHSIWRNYPIIGHVRWLMESLRPELQQYFIERDTDGAPFDYDTRSLVYERAKDTHEEQPFGTELDVYAEGYEWFNHSLAPKPVAAEHRVRIGGPDCSRPYDMALLNVSAMSFGALSSNAIRALNKGAALGGFAHDTGEGGLTDYHLEAGGDLIWEIGSGYLGCRTADGHFDQDTFAAKAAHPHVKCISIKLSQGAKPGLGGVMPGAKVTPEIAAIRGVPVGEKCISPPAHTAFSTPRELIGFISRLRELSGGKPVGFKLCVGKQQDFLAVCKAMLDTGVTPDFIIVDGSEGGTGAAPLEFEDHIGTPLTEGLIFVHNALVGCGLRDRIKIGCSGKIATGFSIVSRLAQGADYTNAARAMMFAVGCIQAQRCHTNTCPVGVATQDPRRARALVVEDKATRVQHFQANTVASANSIIAAIGLDDPSQLGPHLLHRRIDSHTVRTYDQLHHYLEPNQLLGHELPEDWAIWHAANPDTFGP